MSDVEKTLVFGRCYGAISRAVDWIATEFPKGEVRRKRYVNDFLGNSCVMSVLSIVFGNGYDGLSRELLKFRGNDCQTSIGNFINSFQPPSEFPAYVNIYLDVLNDPKSRDKLINHVYEEIVAGCNHCQNKYECLYAFAEFLTFLDPRNNVSKDNYNQRIQKACRVEVTSIIEKNFIDKKNRTGWPHKTTEREEVDPHVTSKILKFFL